MDTDTMILRFRDLVTSENGTIEQHKAIIAKHGYVWWGWWNKDSEKVPDDFSLLSTQAKESPISVFLVDSGQNLLYRAACSDIGIHKKTKGSSPDNPVKKTN